MKNTIQKYLFYLKTAKPKAKKQCFTTYINHQDEIFNVVNRIHKNRVGGTGLIPVPTSHTTVRAVRHTAVP